MVWAAIPKFGKSPIYIFKYGENENQEKSLGQIPFIVIIIISITILCITSHSALSVQAKKINVYIKNNF